MIDQSDFDFRLGYLIHDVSRLRRIVFDRTLAPLKITRSQWRVLELVAQSDGLAQTDLADALDLGKVALGSFIDRLERAGFVSRRTDPGDRRVNRVYLTDEARRCLGELRKEIEKFDATILSEVKETELQAAWRTLLVMKRNLLALHKSTTENRSPDIPSSQTQTL